MVWRGPNRKVWWWSTEIIWRYQQLWGIWWWCVVLLFIWLVTGFRTIKSGLFSKWSVVTAGRQWPTSVYQTVWWLFKCGGEGKFGGIYQSNGTLCLCLYEVLEVIQKFIVGTSVIFLYLADAMRSSWICASKVVCAMILLRRLVFWLRIITLCCSSVILLLTCL